MDSPESTMEADAPVNATDATSNSPPVQESPFSNFVSNFSPLNTENAPRMSQGFLGLSSPPLIFTTPRVNPVRETDFLPRPQNAQLSNAEAPQEDAGNNKFPHKAGDWDKSHLGIPENSGVNNCEQVQHSSSSEHVDKYLADPMEGDSSGYSVDQNLKHSENSLQMSPNDANTAADSLGGTLEFEIKNVSQAEENAPYVLSKPGEVDLKDQVMFDVEQLDNRERQTVSERKYEQCPSAEFQDKCECSSFQNDGGGCRQECNFSSEPMQTAQALEDCCKVVEPISNRSLSNTMLDSEANQQQRGMSRRCLQFEEAQPKDAVNIISSSNASSEENLSRTAGKAAECDMFNSSASFCSRQLISVSQPMPCASNPQSKGKPIIPLAKPSGIGLHLNSIVKAVPFGCDATFSMRLADGSMSIQEMKSEASMNYDSLENKTNAETSGSVIYESIQPIEALKLMQTIDDDATPHDKRKFDPGDPDNFEHYSEHSSKNKKKKSSNGIDDDGCKRCNCKKTKCLKLYCDCFAAGIYCDETCSCQGCLNRLEHAETVLETRRQIESRNPLAFAPKIIQHGSEIPMNNGEDGNLTTPSSARHKRGCNCKKSMCLKKYCECYQGNVGCSSGCRCENCKNIYGKKDDYAAEELMSNRAIVERSEFADNIEIIMAKNNLAHAHLYDNMHKLTPITPSFRSSDHGKGASKSQIIVRRFHPSYTSSLMGQKNPDDDVTRDETGKENSQMGSEYFPSRFGSKIDASRFTPLQNHPTTITSSSASLGCSLHWCGSPITPGAQLGCGKSPQELEPDTQLLNILEDDDTPEILKDGCSTPTKPSVKVSSPSRKRVSPPQRRVNEIGSSSSSSGPLRSGRKFILRAVPSFPPLTPCAESKSLIKQTPADSQHSNDKQ